MARRAGYDSLFRIGGALVLVSALALGSSAAAQEVGAFELRGSAENDEIRSSSGYGAVAALPMGDRVLWRVSVDRREGPGRGRIGQTCARVSSRMTCVYTEPIQSSTRLEGLSVAILPKIEVARRLRIAAGAGITVAQTSYTGHGESGREALVVNPDTAHPGVALQAEVSLLPVPDLPVRIWAAMQRRVLWMDGCDSLDEVHEAFCGLHSFDDVAWGVSVRLGVGS